MYSLVSLEMLRTHLGLAADDNSEELRLLRALEAASLALERRTNRRFSPRFATIAHSIQTSTQLALREDLLELQSINNGDGSTISLNDVLLTSDGALTLLNGQAFVYEESPEDAIELGGIWGYHPDWENAWANSGDSVRNNPLSSSGTALTVLDADAGNPPRFQIGQLLKIENEYLRVTAINSETNVLTVQRGVQGSTAASHNQNSAIFIYQLPEDIASLLIRWGGWLYREADEGFGEIPPALLEGLAMLRRIRV